MSDFKFELNPAGVRELFTSDAMQSFVDQVGADIANTASQMSGAEYGHRTHVADNTAICNVFPDSQEAAIDNSENNTLLKAKSAYPSEKPHL